MLSRVGQVLHLHSCLGILLILLSASALHAQTADEDLADAYADELKLLKAQRDSILKDAALLIQQNGQLFQRAIAAQANSMRAAVAANYTPDYSYSTRETNPSRSGSSRSSSTSSSSSSRKDKVVETTSNSNLGFKGQMAIESNLWALQSQMNLAAMQQVNGVFSQVVQRLVANLNGFCSITDVYGKRCRLESEVAKDLTATWLAADPGDTGALLVRAAALRSLGEIDAAKDHALKAKQMPTPARALASVLLAQCLYLEGKGAEARAEILVAVRLATGTPLKEPAAVAALLDLAEGKVASGRERLYKAIRADSSTGYVAALLALVDCMRAADKSSPKTVSQFIQDQKKQTVRDNRLLLEIETHIYAQQGDFVSASQLAKEMSRHAPESEKFRYAKLVQACENKSLQWDWTQYVKTRWLLPSES